MFTRKLEDIILYEKTWGRENYDFEYDSPLYKDNGELVQPDFWKMLRTDNPWDVNPAVPEYMIGPLNAEDLRAYHELLEEFPDAPWSTWFWLTHPDA